MAAPGPDAEGPRLGAVLIVLGLLEPVATRYQSQIFSRVGNGVRISFPPVTPAAGVGSYVGELGGIGLIVVAVNAAAAATACLLGTLAAWYETASMVRSTLATVGITLAVLLLLPIAGTLRAVDRWLPTTLATAPVDLLNGAHRLSHHLPTFAVAVVVSAAALAIAVLRLRTRDLTRRYTSCRCTLSGRKTDMTSRTESTPAAAPCSSTTR